MFAGIIMVAVTGLLWSMIGVTMSAAARKKQNAWDIMRLTSVCSLVFGGIMLGTNPAMITSVSGDVLLKTSIALIAAGTMNILGVLTMHRAMQHGHNGTIWIICQSALILPFMLGVIVFDEQVTVMRIVGILLILGGMVMSGLFGESGGGEVGGFVRGRRWLIPALAAFVFYGANQCLANLPSYWKLPELSGMLRAFLFQVGSVGVFVALLPIKRIPFSCKSVKPALILAFTAMIGQYFLFYQGLDKLATVGAGSIGFPITVGACIIGFEFYSMFIIREKTSFFQYIALTLEVIGIVLISL